MEEKQLDEIFGFLKNKERVLICSEENSQLGREIASAVSERGGIPSFWGDDLRWNTLLRMAFVGKYGVIVGPSLLLLGLSKLCVQRGIPLFSRYVVITDSCPNWMLDSIRHGLDCRCIVYPVQEEKYPLTDDLLSLREKLLHWSSVLDCRIVRSSYGLEMQVVIFSGKRLPEFPTCAKLNVQNWNPDIHVPFYLIYDLGNLANIP